VKRKGLKRWTKITRFMGEYVGGGGRAFITIYGPASSKGLYVRVTITPLMRGKGRKG